MHRSAVSPSLNFRFPFFHSKRAIAICDFFFVYACILILFDTIVSNINQVFAGLIFIKSYLRNCVQSNAAQSDPKIYNKNMDNKYDNKYKGNK